MPTNLLFNVLSGGCCSEYLATAAFVEEVNNLFDSFMVERVLTKGRHWVAYSVINSPHIDHWKKSKYGGKELGLPQGW
jgi:hypothetical protein